MKMIEMMKKGIVLTLASVMVICSMPTNIEAATGDVVELKLKDTLVNIQVNDQNGKQVIGSKFELYDSSDKKLVSWRSGYVQGLDYDDSLEHIKKTSIVDYNLDYESILGKRIQGVKLARYTDTSKYDLCINEEPLSAIKSNNISLGFEKEGTLRVDYYDYMPTAITIPAKKVGILHKSQNSKGICFGLGESYKYSPRYSKSDVPVLYSANVGEYKTGFGVQNGLAYAGASPIVVSDKSIEYFKIKIHLATVFPNKFTDEGLMILPNSYKNLLGVDVLPRGLTYLSADKTSFANCDFCIISGSLLQVPAIEENGDAEIYISKKTYSYDFYDNYYEKTKNRQSVGGGCRLGRSYDAIRVDLAVKTPKFDAKGITIKGLPEGRYKIVQTMCVDGYEPVSDQYFDVKNDGTINKVIVISKQIINDDPEPEPTPEPSPEPKPTPEPSPEPKPTPEPTPEPSPEPEPTPEPMPESTPESTPVSEPEKISGEEPVQAGENEVEEVITPPSDPQSQPIANKEKVSVKKPNKVKLLSVVNKKEKKIKATWKRDKTAAGYELVYSQKRSFKNAKRVIVKSNKTVSTTIKKLKKGKTYYVKVRAYKKVNGKKIYGSYSSAKKVIVKK